MNIFKRIGYKIDPKFGWHALSNLHEKYMIYKHNRRIKKILKDPGIAKMSSRAGIIKKD